MMEKLFTPVTIGQFALPHRIVFGPLTRFRSSEDQVPKPFVADYYAQRATCQGLLITESVSIAPKAAPYPYTPGIYSRNQILAWKKVAEKVHETGGKIFMQLWHVGREAPSSLLGGDSPVSSSGFTVSRKGRGKYSAALGKPEGESARALEEEEIEEIVQQFVIASQNAVLEAGFDGVEIHGGNGYLIDQFLRNGVNKRTDNYGGSFENRCKFALEVFHAVAKKIGPTRTGIRLSPYGTFNSMSDSNPLPLFTYLLKTLSDQLPDLAYIHFCHLIPKNKNTSVISQENEITELRKVWTGPCIVNLERVSRERAIEFVEENRADLVAIGRDFLANPDLPLRFSQNVPLNLADDDTFYTYDEAGYTDYPFYRTVTSVDETFQSKENE